MHDDPALYPHLPAKPLDPEAAEIMLDPVRGTEWQTCWEYVLTHEMTDREGSAFWHGANLAHAALAQMKREWQAEAWGEGWEAAWSPMSMHNRGDGPNPYRAEASGQGGT